MTNLAAADLSIVQAFMLFATKDIEKKSVVLRKLAPVAHTGGPHPILATNDSRGKRAAVAEQVLSATTLAGHQRW